MPGFNSTLVRLKGEKKDERPIEEYVRFNSTLVRLKEGHITRTENDQGGFNSTLVRLKDKLRAWQSSKRLNVSIPHWFD